MNNFDCISVFFIYIIIHNYTLLLHTDEPLSLFYRITSYTRESEARQKRKMNRL